MLTTSCPSCGVTVYQMVTCSECKRSSYAPGSGSSSGNGSASVGTGSSSRWKIVRWTVQSDWLGKCFYELRVLPRRAARMA